ncbi:MAG: hypothetical protein ORO03_04875, partial [Alphaproteobacteria bacterium]|nr:hypothetical protein [Alphaproteobacteria bacterium]
SLIHIGNNVNDNTIYANDLIHNNHSVTSELDLKFLARGLDQASTLARVFVVTAGDFILPTLTGVTPATPAATVGIFTCTTVQCAVPNSSPDAAITQWWYLTDQFVPTPANASDTSLNTILSRSVDANNLPRNLAKSQLSVVAGRSTGISIPAFTNIVFFGVNGTTSNHHYLDVSGTVKFMGSNSLAGSLHITGSSTTDVALTSAAGDTTSINSLTISGVRHVYMVDSTDVTTGRGTLTIAGTAAIRASGNLYLSGSEVTINELGASAGAIVKLATKGSSLRVSGPITGTTIALTAPSASLIIAANIGNSDTETVALKTGTSNSITIGSVTGAGVTISAKSTTAGKSVTIKGSAVLHPIVLQT